MKQIITLQEYTDKYVSLYEGEIRNIEDGIANKLIEEGIVAEHGETSPDGGGSSKDDKGWVKVDLASLPDFCFYWSNSKIFSLEEFLTDDSIQHGYNVWKLPKSFNPSVGDNILLRTSETSYSSQTSYKFLTSDWKSNIISNGSCYAITNVRALKDSPGAVQLIYGKDLKQGNGEAFENLSSFVEEGEWILVSGQTSQKLTVTGVPSKISTRNSFSSISFKIIES